MTSPPFTNTFDLGRLRTLIGATSTLWAGDGGVTRQARGWTAISGGRSVDYNVVLCHGASAGADLETGVRRILDAGVPGMMMVAGAALGEVQTLVGLGWVCVGDVPLMVMDLSPGCDLAPAVGVRRLGADELDLARAIIAEAFDLDPAMSVVAIPPGTAQRTGRSVWAAFDGGLRPKACLSAVHAGETVVIWSMATAASARRQGYGAAVLRGALAAHAGQGVRWALLYSSRAGEPLYRGVGFRELERWQLWSRPRWLLGRA